MAASSDLIDFNAIETQKENIQALPSGRSAKALAQLYSPLSPFAHPSPPDAHHAARQSFERELHLLADSDDPLDIFDRYVKWTLDAYPSAQATPASQLLPLLERATKSFLAAPHYRNDPRYLKLWLLHIRFFADAPRETYRFLARNGVADALALFYEEYAAWLEGAGRWAQAEEIYLMGLEKEARPAERLLRKFAEFQHRRDERAREGGADDGPGSPALPTVRPALAAKVDPFAGAVEEGDPQARTRGEGAVRTTGRNKLAIFSDTEGGSQEALGAGGGAKWESIGSYEERKKENTREAKPWVGETLKGGGKRNVGAPKMMIFKDGVPPSQERHESNPWHEQQETINPKTGRRECVFVNLEAVYPSQDDMSSEFCFEELRAKHRGWLDMDWSCQPSVREHESHPDELKEDMAERVVSELAEDLQEVLDVNDENAPPSPRELETIKRAKKARREEKANRTRKIKVLEVHAATQIVQANLSSPSGPKIKRKKTAEPTMTINTKEAMDEIYDIFNQPLKGFEPAEEQQEEEEESEDDEDDYTSAGESTGTGRISATTSDYGDETTAADFTEAGSVGGNDTANDTGISGFTDFSEAKRADVDEEDDTESQELDAHTPVDEEFQDDVRSDGLDEAQFDSPADDEEEYDDRQSAAPYSYPERSRGAGRRLPFMTPIVEKTESSLGAVTALAEKNYIHAKTPSRRQGDATPAIAESDDDDPWSSPFHNMTGDGLEDLKKAMRTGNDAPKISQPQLVPSKPAPITNFEKAKEKAAKGPIIHDAQCNPCDVAIRNTILENAQPLLAAHDGYYNHQDKTKGMGFEIQKFIKASVKSRKSGHDKTAPNLLLPPTINLEGSDRTYTVKRELGKGAYAPVYLVQSTERTQDEDEEPKVQMGKGEFGIKRQELEAIKMEDPPNAWEFYLVRQAKRRLGVSRAAESIINIYEMHLYMDEGYLIEEYRDQGTLLDPINLARMDVAGGGLLDEQVAMFFTVELLRTVEALHAKGIIHGDLKADNVLVRFEHGVRSSAWSSAYARDGSNGWADRGVALIDFGRGIDMKAFVPSVQFFADWKPSEVDCAEIREMRPWTYQVDYHGLAGVIHTLLFGKYIETTAERAATLGAGATKTYKIREPLKRYWQTELWSELLNVLLNPLMHLDGEEGSKMPMLKGMKACRERMEAYLESNSEKGLGLKNLLKRLEVNLKEKR
ncbi:hypothetical protein P152DRAFT_388456 [Eremomyces bilateralis CBS 781.70]|uniref:Kinase-like protein n=1 Tax=Eremomyces bilateralis CBS 781.70 TaxID=1392243 RepID=A0A6G1GDX4_9PEZI|nr:uncharacterized protein P152DRAFT_388456 [Eremomyces bilateralis CBS 781.70]KAF1816232.1 hypothetical protein P152DRAFT_388456 [Eremomyces bilateralis CBS 781.70]